MTISQRRLEAPMMLVGLTALSVLIRTKRLAAMSYSRVCGLVGTDRVVLDGLAGAVLHQRHMLVSCCMVDDLRMIGLEHLEDFSENLVTEPMMHIQLQVRIFLFQLLLNVVGIVLIYIKDDQLLWDRGLAI